LAGINHKVSGRRHNSINPGIGREDVEKGFKHNLAASAVLKHIFAASLSRLVSVAESERTDHEIQPIGEKKSAAGKILCVFYCMCATHHLYMRRKETSLEVKRWFQDTTRDLWPIAVGSLSLRKSPCIRERCGLCESGVGHSSYALYGRKGKRRFSIYVPDELAPELERAIQNGRHLQELMMEAGRRYTLALKKERRARRQQ